MNKWPGAPFLGSLHPSGAQNKTLISNTGLIMMHDFEYLCTRCVDKINA